MMDKAKRDLIEQRYLGPVEPDSCGSCLKRTENGQPVEHHKCARRAVLLPAPDAPCYEAILDVPEDQRCHLPARFHTPVFDNAGSRKVWVCAVCWGDGWGTSWPCATAIEHGAEVFTPEHHTSKLRTDLAALIVETVTAKAAGWRAAADAMAELVTNHGHDADREMVLFSLQRGAELREQFADIQINHLKETT